MNILPKPPGIFVGREKELEKLKKKFNEENLIIIDGLAGTGKTALALTMAGLINENPLYHGRVYWITCKENFKEEELFQEFRKCFNLDFPEEREEKIKYLASLLNKEPSAIFIDDYHKVDPLLSSFFIEKFAEYASKIIIITREKPLISDLIGFDIFEQQLQCLDESNFTLLIKFFLDSYDITFEDDTDYIINELLNFQGDNKFEEKIIRDLYRVTSGHPFVTKTLFHIISSGNYKIKDILRDPSILRKNIKTYQEELIKNLDEKEKELLFFLSLFRLPVTKEDLLHENHGKDMEKLIKKLEDNFFLIPCPENSCFVHDLLRDFCNNITYDKRENHKNCALYYENKINAFSEKRLLMAREAFYHYMQDENIKKCVEILENIMDEMVKYLLFEELRYYIDKIPDEHKTDRIILVNGKILFLQEKYGECLELLKKIDIKENILPALINLKARCYSGLKNYKKAGEIIERNINLLEEREEYINTLGIMGEINFNLRNYKEGMNYVKKGLNKDEGNTVLLTLKGMLLERQGLAYEALKIHLKALEIAEKANNFVEIPVIKINIGQDYYHLGELEEGDKFLQKGLENSYNDSLKFQSFHILALIYEEKKDKEKALNYFTKALEISKKKGDKEKEIIVTAALASLYLKIGKVKEIKLPENKYIDDLPDYLQTDYSLLLAEISILENNLKEARKFIQGALDLCDKNDNFLLFRANYLMSIIEKKDRTTREEESLVYFGKLFGYEKRKALTFYSHLEKQASLEDSYLIKTKDREYYSDLSEVENLKKDMESFDLFIDLSEGIVWEKSRGYVDFSRKKNLASLLFHFVRNAGESFSLESLYTSIWKNKFNKKTDSITLRTSLSRLRKLLEPEETKYIKILSLPCQRDSKYYFSKEVNFCLIQKAE